MMISFEIVRQVIHATGVIPISIAKSRSIHSLRLIPHLYMVNLPAYAYLRQGLAIWPCLHHLKMTTLWRTPDPFYPASFYTKYNHLLFCSSPSHLSIYIPRCPLVLCPEEPIKVPIDEIHTLEDLNRQRIRNGAGQQP